MESLILTAGLDKSCADKIARHFTPPRYRVSRYSNPAKIYPAIDRDEPEILLLGAQGQSIDEGLPLVRQIRVINSLLPIIFISKKSSEARAISAFRAGVNDYFKMPIPYRHLYRSIEKLTKSTIYQPFESTKAVDYSQPTMVGQSDVMQRTSAYLIRVASTASTVLITGETGTGKELAAQMVHRYSRRHGKPFVSVNCAALPENLVESELFGYERGAFTGAHTAKKGKFELSHGGTVLLDEIGDMNPYAQAKILTAIESKIIYPLGGKRSIPVDMRILAATNQDPENLIREGKFREDLYYRLNIARVHMPALRLRRNDIPELVSYGIGRLNRQFDRELKGLSQEAMQWCMQYNWPGNVRELNNFLEAIYINLPHQPVRYADLPRNLKRPCRHIAQPSQNERHTIVAALLANKWNKSKAAQKLKWSRMTLYRKIAKYNISRDFPHDR
ncbi:MAG: sigma-54 dependent transcriptional regulator [Flavobacteriaceae bacterium]